MNKIILILAVAAAFFAVKYGMVNAEKNAAMKSANAEIDAIRADVRKNNPDEPEVLAVHEAASKKMVENINAKGTIKEKQKTAAGSFLGYYLVNYRQRAEYCKNLGVDITPFISAFKALHEDEYAVAVKAVSATSEKIDELFRGLQPQLVTVIEQDMEYVANENGVSLAEACRLISDHADILVPDMHISLSQPLVYQALMPGG